MSLCSNITAHYDRITVASDKLPIVWQPNAPGWHHRQNLTLDRKHPIKYTLCYYGCNDDIRFTLLGQPIRLPYIGHVPEWLLSFNLTYCSRNKAENLLLSIWGDLTALELSRIEIALDIEMPTEEARKCIAYYGRHTTLPFETGGYFGRPRSRSQICFYDKAAQLELPALQWFRLERRLRFSGKKRVAISDFLNGAYLKKLKTGPFGNRLILADYHEVANVLDQQGDSDLAASVRMEGLEYVNNNLNIPAKRRRTIRSIVRSCATDINRIFLAYANQWHQSAQHDVPDWLVPDAISPETIEELVLDTFLPSQA